MTEKGWTVSLKSTVQAPNYFFTKDLSTFTKISDLQPQNAYNWYTTELHAYTDSFGNQLQGVLYRPENFDSSKKYPLLFMIYESMSDKLNEFITPDMVGANFSIPVMVSNGYLVFTPDIRGKINYAGDAALRCVNAAADHLDKYPWINKSKMGLAGHSFGGFEANYILTHSDRFAAVLSGAGISDMISFASGVWGSGDGQQDMAQSSYLLMGKTLAEDPDSYIRNSPILSSKQVKTPVLFLHNDGDGSVNFTQTRSFFITLRSLQKPAWWLNYKGQGHGVGDEKSQLDFNTKVWQFFDHYLKDKPMPDWMKEHI